MCICLRFQIHKLLENILRETLTPRPLAYVCKLVRFCTRPKRMFEKHMVVLRVCVCVCDGGNSKDIYRPVSGCAWIVCGHICLVEDSYLLLLVTIGFSRQNSQIWHWCFISNLKNGSPAATAVLNIGTWQNKYNYYHVLLLLSSWSSSSPSKLLTLLSFLLINKSIKQSVNDLLMYVGQWAAMHRIWVCVVQVIEDLGTCAGVSVDQGLWR